MAYVKGNLNIRTYTSGNAAGAQFVDDGPGIPKGALGNIFDPFFTAKKVGKRTGVEIRLSYRIIKEHNGNIPAESKKGREQNS